MRITSTPRLARGSKRLHPREQFRERWRSRPSKALISVHRGLWGPAPENSREGISKGAAFGIVEIDVQMAFDGVPIVMHDSDLVRMTGDQRDVRDVSSDEIASLPLLQGDGGSDAIPSSETVPTLSQVLDAAPEGIFFDFDVKHPHEVEAVAKFLADHGFHQMGSLKIDVESEADIAHLADLENQFGIMVMAKVVISPSSLPLFPLLADAGVAAAEVWFDDLDLLAQASRSVGDTLAMSTYTLDPVHCCGLSDKRALVEPQAVWGQLLQAGVTIIMTDQAPALSPFLKDLPS